PSGRALGRSARTGDPTRAALGPESFRFGCADSAPAAACRERSPQFVRPIRRISWRTHRGRSKGGLLLRQQNWSKSNNPQVPFAKATKQLVQFVARQLPGGVSHLRL